MTLLSNLFKTMLGACYASHQHFHSSFGLFLPTQSASLIFQVLYFILKTVGSVQSLALEQITLFIH